MRAASTNSLTTDDLQLNIALWIHEWICEFSPSLTLSLTKEPSRHTNTLGEKEEGGEVAVGE